MSREIWLSKEWVKLNSWPRKAKEYDTQYIEFKEYQELKDIYEKSEKQNTEIIHNLVKRNRELERKLDERREG